MHWVQDCFRANDIPNHNDFDEPALFEALCLSQIRKSDINLVNTNTKEANPGKFKDKCKLLEWEKSFINYLLVKPGVSGIPLLYLVRDEEFPAAGFVYATSNNRMVNRAPLSGQYYVANSWRVHNLLAGFLQRENTENWICNIAKHQDGSRDMIALRRHDYAGNDNYTRRIADAKRMQATLHYKTERALPFNKFLDSLQKMFTIFEDENEPLTERAKVDKLLSKVQATTMLNAAVAQLRYQPDTAGVTFTVAA